MMMGAVPGPFDQAPEAFDRVCVNARVEVVPGIRTVMLGGPKPLHGRI